MLKGEDPDPDPKLIILNTEPWKQKISDPGGSKTQFVLIYFRPEENIGLLQFYIAWDIHLYFTMYGTPPD